MHMMSKKELSSEEMGTEKRSRNPTVVLTANGEAHTHEDAQEFVHDLNQFVTVQLLEETPAILSLGKLCKDHGYSFEWVSGQEPRLTREGKSIICKTDNFVPLVVPGLSVNSGSSSFPTSLPQESLRHRSSPSRAPSSSSSRSVFERSDEQATRRLGQESLKIQNQRKKRDDKKDANDPLADLPFWLEDFKDDLVDAELPAPAHSSRETDLGHPVEVVTKSRKHSIETHFPKDRNCDVCWRTKIAKDSCRRRTGEALRRAETFGDVITADHKVLNVECESRDNHRHAVVVQDLATQWIQSHPCKTKSSRETEKSLSKFLEPSHRPKVVYTDNSMEFGRACEVLSWNHRTSTPHRSETDGIAERAVRRVKEGTSAALLQSGLDERWWSDSMECCFYLRSGRDLLAAETIWRTTQKGQ